MINQKRDLGLCFPTLPGSRPSKLGSIDGGMGTTIIAQRSLLQRRYIFPPWRCMMQCIIELPSPPPPSFPPRQYHRQECMKFPPLRGVPEALEGSCCVQRESSIERCRGAVACMCHALRMFIGAPEIGMRKEVVIKASRICPWRGCTLRAAVKDGRRMMGTALRRGYIGRPIRSS